MKTYQLLLISTLIAFAMSGGVHRIAQSRWNIPNSAQTTKLHLYFMLDSGLPYTSTNYQASLLRVGLPSTMSAFSVPTSSACFAWAIADTLVAPTATASQITGTLTLSTYHYISFAAALSANTAYGLQITGSGTLAAGSFAPVSLATYAGKSDSAYTGPYMDYNPVFDSVFVSAASVAVTLASAKVADATSCTTCNSAQDNPSETVAITWTMSSFGLTDGTYINVPYNIVLTFAAPVLMADGTTYYDNWSFATTCTNTKFGVDVTANGVTTTPLMNTVAPTCTQTTSTTDGNILTIAVTDSNDSMRPSTWTNWEVAFTISVTNPSNYLGVSPSVNLAIVNGYNGNVIAKTSSAHSSSVLSVSTDTALVTATSSSTSTTGDCTPLVAWGVNPLVAANALLGAGIYSEVYCLTTAQAQLLNQWSNCFNAFDNSADDDGIPDAVIAPRVVNALELSWRMPYAIPSDDTKVGLVCSTAGMINSAGNWGMYQSSIVTNVGAGNCYFTTTAQTSSTDLFHNIHCMNVGALASGTDLLFAFQFYITNAGKSWGATGLTIKTLGLTFVCTLTVTNTQATVAKTWYTSTVTMDVDGGATGHWLYETFIWQDVQKMGGHIILVDAAAAVADLAYKKSASEDWSNCVAASHTFAGTITFADTSSNQYKKGGSDAASPAVSLFFYGHDTYTAVTGGVARISRKWVFDLALLTAAFNTWKLQTIMYGKESYLTTNSVTLTSSWAAAPLHASSFDTARLASTAGTNGYAGAAVIWTVNVATTNAMIHTTDNLGFTTAESTAQTEAQAVAATSDAAVYSVATTMLFQWNTIQADQYQTSQTANFVITHEQAYIFASPLILTWYTFTYNGIWSSASIDHLTAFRGRGGQGSTSQRLAQHVWSLTTNESAPGWHIRTLVHTYLAVSATATNYATANTAIVGWPLWVEAAANDDSPAIEQNDGAYVWNTVKIYLGAIANPDNWVGTFMPTGQPFWKSTGDNAVYNLMDNTAGSTECYYFGCITNYCVAPSVNSMWGSGVSYANAVLRKYPVDGYGIEKFRATSLLTCKISDHTATGTNVIIVPFKNQYLTDAMVVSTTATASNLLSQWLTGLGTNAQSAMLVFGTDFNIEQMTTYYASTATAFVALTAFGANAKMTSANLPLAAESGVVITKSAYDLTVASSGHTVGATGVDANLAVTVASGTSIWTAVQELTEFCGSYDYLLGANVATVTENSVACLRLALPTVSTSDTSTLQLECVFCKGLASGQAHTYVMGTMNLPVTSLGTTSGISYVQTDNTVDQHFVLNTDATATAQLGALVTECSITPSAGTAYTTFKGQEIVFGLTPGNGLAPAMVLRWEQTDSSASSNHITASTIASSVTMFCAGVEMTGTSATAFALSNNGALVSMPADTTATTNNAASCASGSQVTAQVRVWSTASQTTTAATSGVCYGTYSTGNLASTTYTAHDALTDTDTCAVAVSTVTWSYTQTTDLTQTTMTVSANFQPNALNSYGKFTFSPTIGAKVKLYKQYSVIAYVFGNFDMTANSMCRVMNSAGTALSEAVASCVVSSATVTLMMNQDASSASFQVEVLNAGLGWTWSTDTVTGTLTNYGSQIQTMGSTTVTMTATVGAAPTTSLLVSTIALAKTYKYTMDVGILNFTCTMTVTNNTWTSDSYALIQLPNYYRADVGDAVVCTLLTSTSTTEQLWCQVAWDWTLKVWGPSANAQAAATAFNLVITGVSMNNAPTTALKFQVGFANSTGTLLDTPFTEFGQIVDVLITSTDAWKGLLALEVYSVASSSLATRGTTTLTVLFGLPAQTGTATNALASGFLTLQLPYQWGKVFQSSSDVGSVSLSSMSGSTGTSVGSTVLYWTGCSVTVGIDTANWTEGTNYTLVVNSVPTPQSAFDTNLGSFVLSLGTQSTGSYAWSNQQFSHSATPVMAVATGLNELSYSSSSLTVIRGSYSAYFCITPGTGNQFRGDATFTVTGSTFKTVPTTLSAYQGNTQTCGHLGTAITTPATYYWVTFTKVETGTAKYTGLPYLMVLVSSGATTWTVPTVATCTLEGNSIPLVLTVPNSPFTDVTMTLGLTTYTGTNPNPSENITVPSTVLTYSTSVTFGTISFSCGATLASTTTPTVNYTMAGTDAAAYTLSGTLVTVTGVAKGTAATTPTVTLVMDATNSKASSTILSATCGDGVGTGYVWFAPTGTDVVTANQTNVEAAYTAYAATQNSATYNASNAHLGAQWSQFTVLDTSTAYSNTFGSKSNTAYVAMLYCVTTDPFFYPLSATLAVTSADNGGKVTKVTLAYGVAIDDITNNNIVLSILCVVAENLMLAPNMVQDAYGGYCGYTSPYLPSAVANVTNSSRILSTTWNVDMYFQPSDTADSVDNTAYQASVSGITTQIDAVTSAAYGSVLSVTATTAGIVTEAALSFSTAPVVATSTDYALSTMTGATNVTGYVYLAWQTTADDLSTTVSQNVTNTSSLLDWTATAYQSAYTFHRATTTASALTFSFPKTTVVNKQYSWYAQATSLNPDPSKAQYKSDFKNAVHSTACRADDTTSSGCTTTGSEAILSSLMFVMMSLIVSFLY